MVAISFRSIFVFRICSNIHSILFEHIILIFMDDDAQVSTIKYGAIKQFHHYKIHGRFVIYGGVMRAIADGCAIHDASVV